MSTRTVRIWFWIFNDRLLKAVSCPEDGTLIIYDEYDNILIKRTGLTPAQIKKIEITIANSEAKRVDGHKESFPTFFYFTVKNTRRSG